MTHLYGTVLCVPQLIHSYGLHSNLIKTGKPDGLKFISLIIHFKLLTHMYTIFPIFILVIFIIRHMYLFNEFSGG